MQRKCFEIHWNSQILPSRVRRLSGQSERDARVIYIYIYANALSGAVIFRISSLIQLSLVEERRKIKLPTLDRYNSKIARTKDSYSCSRQTTPKNSKLMLAIQINQCQIQTVTKFRKNSVKKRKKSIFHYINSVSILHFKICSWEIYIYIYYKKSLYNCTNFILSLNLSHIVSTLT